MHAVMTTIRELVCHGRDVCLFSGTRSIALPLLVFAILLEFIELEIYRTAALLPCLYPLSV